MLEKIELNSDWEDAELKLVSNGKKKFTQEVFFSFFFS